MRSCTSTIRRGTLAAVLLMCSTVAQAVLTVSAPWVRPTPDRAATDAYMVLTSTEGAIAEGG